MNSKYSVHELSKSSFCLLCDIESSPEYEILLAAVLSEDFGYEHNSTRFFTTYSKLFSSKEIHPSVLSVRSLTLLSIFTGSIKLTSIARERIAATPSVTKPDSFSIPRDTKGK